MEAKYSESLGEKEESKIRKEKEKFLQKEDELMKSKEKTPDEILNDLFSKCREKAKSKIEKMKEQIVSMKKIDILVEEKAKFVASKEKSKKEALVLKMLMDSLEKKQTEIHDKYKATVETQQNLRKELNDKMQAEIQSVQKELEEDMKRKSGLKGENEELEHRLGELKEMFQKTSESVEKTLGKSEFDMSGLEEQIRSKIEVETTKMVVYLISSIDFRMTKKKKSRLKMRKWPVESKESSKKLTSIQSDSKTINKKFPKLMPI